MTVFKTKTRDRIAGCLFLFFVAALLGTGVWSNHLDGQARPPQPLQPPATVSYTTGSATGTSNTPLVAGSSGLRFNVTEVSCANTSSSPTGLQIQNNGVSIYVLPCPVSSGGAALYSFANPISMTSTNSTLGFAFTNAVTTGYASFRYYLTR